jgi:hypothetical protein
VIIRGRYFIVHGEVYVTSEVKSKSGTSAVVPVGMQGAALQDVSRPAVRNRPRLQYPPIAAAIDTSLSAPRHWPLQAPQGGTLPLSLSLSLSLSLPLLPPILLAPTDADTWCWHVVPHLSGRGTSAANFPASLASVVASHHCSLMLWWGAWLGQENLPGNRPPSPTKQLSLAQNLLIQPQVCQPASQ